MILISKSIFSYIGKIEKKKRKEEKTRSEYGSIEFCQIHNPDSVTGLSLP